MSGEEWECRVACPRCGGMAMARLRTAERTDAAQWYRGASLCLHSDCGYFGPSSRRVPITRTLEAVGR